MSEEPTTRRGSKTLLLIAAGFIIGLLLLAFVVSSQGLSDVEQQLRVELDKYKPGTSEVVVGIVWVAGADTLDLQSVLAKDAREIVAAGNATELGSSTRRTGSARFPSGSPGARLIEPILGLFKPAYREEGHVVFHFKAAEPAAVAYRISSKWKSELARLPSKLRQDFRYAIADSSLGK
jgi:hypothetical protein